MDDFLAGGRKPQAPENKAAMFSAMMEQAKEAFRMRKRLESPAQAAIPAKVLARVRGESNNGG